jgi:hypothetical protein
MLSESNNSQSQSNICYSRVAGKHFEKREENIPRNAWWSTSSIPSAHNPCGSGHPCKSTPLSSLPPNDSYLPSPTMASRTVSDDSCLPSPMKHGITKEPMYGPTMTLIRRICLPCLNYDRDLPLGPCCVTAGDGADALAADLEGGG